MKRIKEGMVVTNRYDHNQYIVIQVLDHAVLVEKDSNVTEMAISDIDLPQ